MLGTDGIGADMLDEFRSRSSVTARTTCEASPDVAWSWLANGWELVPEARGDAVRWSYDEMEPWQLAYTTDVRAIDVEIDGEVVLRDGVATRVDPRRGASEGRRAGSPPPPAAMTV